MSITITFEGEEPITIPAPKNDAEASFLERACEQLDPPVVGAADDDSEVAAGLRDFYFHLLAFRKNVPANLVRLDFITAEALADLTEFFYPAEGATSSAAGRLEVLYERAATGHEYEREEIRAKRAKLARLVGDAERAMDRQEEALAALHPRGGGER